MERLSSDHSEYDRFVRSSIHVLQICASLLFVVPAFAQWSGEIDSAIWQLPSSNTGHRWLVIHNVETAKSEGIYHIEVLERAFGAEVWNIKHIANHMAVSPAALRASILNPLKKGAVYPDSYNSGYAEWRKENESGKAFICMTTVLSCLK